MDGLHIDIASEHPKAPHAFEMAFCRTFNPVPPEYLRVGLLPTKFLHSIRTDAEAEANATEPGKAVEAKGKKPSKKAAPKKPAAPAPGSPENYDALIVPIISSGDMARNSALAVRNFLGREIETTLKELIRDDYGGDAPVGTGLTIDLSDEARPRLLIAVVVMRVYHAIEATPNVYYAMKGALWEIVRYNQKVPEGGAPIERVLMPLLGTGLGEMPHFRAMLQLRHAFDAMVLGRGEALRAQQCGASSVEFQTQAGFHAVICGVKAAYPMRPA